MTTSKLYPCCSDPSCDMCYGSGIADNDNLKVIELNRWLEQLVEQEKEKERGGQETGA